MGLSTIDTMTDILSVRDEYALSLSQVPVMMAGIVAQVASPVRARCLSFLKLI